MFVKIKKEIRTNNNTKGILNSDILVHFPNFSL